jgi:hypothetical protein
MSELHAFSSAASLPRKLPEVFLRLIAQFPHSSNLQGPIFRLIRSEIKSPEHSNLFLHQFIPYAMVEARSSVRSPASAQCMTLLIAFDADLKSGACNADGVTAGAFAPFKKWFLMPYQRLMPMPYGGVSEQEPRRDTAFTFYHKWSAISP